LREEEEGAATSERWRLARVAISQLASNSDEE
jgi:hypothetical protein